jgi:hypothetical protein
MIYLPNWQQTLCFCHSVRQHQPMTSMHITWPFHQLGDFCCHDPLSPSAVDRCTGHRHWHLHGCAGVGNSKLDQKRREVPVRLFSGWQRTGQLLAPGEPFSAEFAGLGLQLARQRPLPDQTESSLFHLEYAGRSTACLGQQDLPCIAVL